MIKWIIPIIIVISLLCPNIIMASSDFYTVQKGDTLSGIAIKIFGDENKWRELWRKNPDIMDPNMIYVGQKLLINGSPPPIMQITREELKDRLIRHMFKVRGLSFITRTGANLLVKRYEALLEDLPSQSTYLKRKTLPHYNEALLKQELHFLIDSIMNITREDVDYEMIYMLTAIAWQESHFLNRRGTKEEITVYQFLPSTLQQYIEDPMMLPLIEDDPLRATQIAYRLLKDLKRKYGTWEAALQYYNTNPNYPSWVLGKVWLLKR